MKVLMVCLGNICRSPLAAGILNEFFKRGNIHATADSAGFEPYHIGEHADERALSIANDYGIDISSHRARLFRREDFDIYDRIFVMDSSNYHDVIYLARNENDIKKVDYIIKENMN